MMDEGRQTFSRAGDGEPDTAILTQAPTTPKFTNGPLKRVMTFLAFPLFYALNRPSLQVLAEAAYDFALRWNGFAIGFEGRHGLSHAEERFLSRRLPAMDAGVLSAPIMAPTRTSCAGFRRPRKSMRSSRIRRPSPPCSNAPPGRSSRW